MKIAFFLSSRNIVPPINTGGIEQPAYYLIRELVKRGHKITLFSAPGSKIPNVPLKEMSPFPILTKLKHGNLEERVANFYDFTALANFFISDQQEKFDLIQFNDYLFYKILPFANFSKVPIIIQINYPHGEVYPHLKNAISKIKNVYYLPMSNYIKEVMPGLNYLPPLYPAISVKDFPLSKEKREHLLFIGRICFNKGVHLAIEAAKKTKQKLIIAGPVKDADQTYFDSQIKPHLDNKEITYVGEVDFKTKIKLYQRAKATLFPTLWDEPFGIVLIESMACGTPVIAFDRAAAREIIRNKVSGFIIKDGDTNAMAKAINNADCLKRLLIRQRVINNFSIEKAAKQYEKTSEKIIRKKLNKAL